VGGDPIFSVGCNDLEGDADSLGGSGGGEEDEIVVGGDDKTMEGPEEENPSCCVALDDVFDDAVVIDWGGSNFVLNVSSTFL
jgi:hypothetical protein